MKKLILTIILIMAVTGGPAPASADVDRGTMRVEFLYSIENAGARNERLREPFDIFFDRDKRELYVVDPGRHSLYIYDDNGMFVQQIPLAGGPRMAAVDREGQIYIGHLDSPRISLLDYRGERLDEFELPEKVHVEGKMVRPLYFTRGPEGAIYALKSNGAIVKMDPFGESHQPVELAGQDAPNMIFGMTVDSAGRFLFTDMRPYSVVIFDPKKQNFKRFGEGGVLYGQLDRPIGIAADEKGHIFVVSTVTNKVTCYDKDGKFIEEFGGIGETYGRFYFPSKIVSDGKDRIFVLENALKRIQVFRVEFLKEKEVVEGSTAVSQEQDKTTAAMQVSSRQ